MTNGRSKTALFIDGANIRQAAKRLSMYIDFAKLATYLDEAFPDDKIIRRYYYTALIGTEDKDTVRDLTTWLSHNGYHTVTKQARTFVDEVGQSTIKGNMDIELAIDMMKAARYLDHAILMSGDGDFTKLVQVVQDEGVQVTVISTRVGGTCSGDLRRQADRFIDLSDIRQMIEQDRSNHHANYATNPTNPTNGPSQQPPTTSNS